MTVLGLSAIATSGFGSMGGKKAKQQMENILLQSEGDESHWDEEDIGPGNSSKALSLTWPQESLGHTLNLAYKLDQNLDSADCPICFESLGKVSQIYRLACQHRFCKKCIDNFSPDSNTALCPSCRTSFNRKEISKFNSISEAQRSCPTKCTHPKCLWDGSLELMKTMQQAGEVPSCPYPFTNFEGIPATNFLENCQQFLIDWLRERFSGKGYNIHYLSFHDKLSEHYDVKTLTRREEAGNRPGIALKVQHNNSPTPIDLYFSAVDIDDKGESGEDCFSTFVLDYRTDILMGNLRHQRPNVFDENSQLYIAHYDIHADTLRLIANKDKYVLRLSNFWDPRKRILSYEKLKTDMEAQGLEYALLFKKAEPTYRPVQYDYYPIAPKSRRYSFRGFGSEPVHITPESYYPSEAIFAGLPAYIYPESSQSTGEPDVPAGEETFDIP